MQKLFHFDEINTATFYTSTVRKSSPIHIIWDMQSGGKGVGADVDLRGRQCHFHKSAGMLGNLELDTEKLTKIALFVASLYIEGNQGKVQSSGDEAIIFFASVTGQIHTELQNMFLYIECLTDLPPIPDAYA